MVPEGSLDEDGDGTQDGAAGAESWELFMDIDEGMVKIGDDEGVAMEGHQPRICKAEVGYMTNVESILANLTSPLEVTYTVDPREIMQNLTAWEPAIRKEVKTVEIAIQRLLNGTPERTAWLSKPGIQRLPSKLVFTVKPGNNPDPSDPSTWWKRKARLVVCGNLAGSTTDNLYAESAPSEAVRSCLTLTCGRGWEVGICDVVAAFLKTPIGRRESDPRIVVAPPRLLERLGLSESLELWGLVRARYGLKQSPSLWSNFRDDMINQFVLPEGCRLRQGPTVRCWWSIVDGHGDTIGVLVVYVDDFMICGKRPTIDLLYGIIRGLWDTTDLAILTSENPIRFLGMELSMVDSEPKVIYISQHGYIQELLRHHELGTSRLDKVPISKELASFTVEESDVKPDDYTVHQAQQLTGEVLWVAQRSRPDLSFTTALMSTLCTRAPYRVLEVGYKALGYLKRTANYKLRVAWIDSPLTMFCDAAYAPQSERTHGGWMVEFSSVPVVWRSGRQALITLSTAESELLAMTDGAIALKGVECLLADLGFQIGAREIASDSLAALGISSGASSWRTRHLRIRAGWLVEQISHGLIRTRHCPGEQQPADLLTKPLSSQRFQQLLRLWGIGEYPNTSSTPLASRLSLTSSRITLALVCCLLIMNVEASSGESSSGVSLDSDMMGAAMMLVMILGMVMVWEGLKWLVMEINYEWTPGASRRRLRRLEKLREATTRAIQDELERRAAATPTRTSRREPQPPREPLSESTSSTTTTRRATTPVATEDEGVRRRAPAPSTPPRRPTVVHDSPGGWSITSDYEGMTSIDEYERLCKDTIMLMRCEEIKDGLRHHGLRTSGLKEDMATRLAVEMNARRDHSQSPTARQLRYLLWLWRSKDLNGRILLHYTSLQNKTEASRTIHAWKSRG